MYVTREEENKNRAISASITAAIMALLLLFLILYNIITPNPPFAPGGGGQELGLGMINLGSGDIEYGQIGEVNDVVAEAKEETTPPTKPNEEAVVTAENGEDVKLKEEKEVKPEIKNNTTVVTPVKPKEKTEAEKLLEKFKKNAGKNGGGIGDNPTEGQNGAPNGDPTKEGNGGHGNGNGGGEGDNKGPGTGIGPGGDGNGTKYGFNLKGRAIVNPPTLPKDTKEEGKVVVEITVDKNGNVIEANPNGRGTTTSSPILKAKAKQAALATKFNVSGQFEEQTGTITIIFAFN
jgi:TonB family protein